MTVRQDVANKRSLLGRKLYMFLMKEMKNSDMKLIVNENSVTDKLVLDSDKGKIRKFIASLELDIFSYSVRNQNEIMLGAIDAWKAIGINPAHKEEKSFIWNFTDGSKKIENATVYTYKQLKYKECIVLG